MSDVGTHRIVSDALGPAWQEVDSPLGAVGRWQSPGASHEALLKRSGRAWQLLLLDTTGPRARTVEAWTLRPAHLSLVPQSSRGERGWDALSSSLERIVKENEMSNDPVEGAVDRLVEQDGDPYDPYLLGHEAGETVATDLQASMDMAYYSWGWVRSFLVAFSASLRRTLWAGGRDEL